MTDLFTYGSLMCSDIMEKVTGCAIPGEEAILEGYFRSAIKNEEYPGITKRTGSRVHGILYRDLDSNAIRRLDRFEGDLYVRREVEVISKATGKNKAVVYVIRQEYLTILTNEPWSFQNFLTTGKKRFMSRYRGFLQDAE